MEGIAQVQIFKDFDGYSPKYNLQEFIVRSDKRLNPWAIGTRPLIRLHRMPAYFTLVVIMGQFAIVQGIIGRNLMEMLWYSPAQIA